ncbi:MAG: right-handed parallel beta-helix repeat-containing protein, partial [Candidatus Thorarchaeota archaeon]
PNNVITNCTVNYGSEAGIQLSNSDHVTITDCYVYHSGDGFNIGSSDFVTIETSSVWDSYARGIYISNCWNTTLDDNDVYDNAEYSSSGIELRNSSNSTVKNNDLFNNYHIGLYIYNGFRCDVFSNNIYNNSEKGIDVGHSCNLITISYNMIHDNGWWNPSQESIAGIFSGVIINMTIHKNTIYNNSQNGILMNGTYKPIITENEIYDNPLTGIYADHVDYAHVEMNHIHDNGWNDTAQKHNGLYATFSNEWGVFGNEIVHNSHSGMIFFDSFGHLIENNFVNWSVGYGIGLVRTTDSVVTGNHLVGHLSNCIRGTLADRCNITNNVIQGANSSIHLIYSDDVHILHNIIWGALTFGIWMDNTNNSVAYYNDIGWNGIANAIDEGTGNTWDDGSSIGNWWHNWEVGSGPYNISDLSAVVQNQDKHPNRSVEILGTPSPIAYEISSTGHTMDFAADGLNLKAFEAYANGTLIDSGEFYGGLVEVDVDGLDAGYNVIVLRAIHFSDNYEWTHSSVTVQDLTPPEWITGPHDELLRPNELFSQQLEASDPSGIGSWYTNDTTNFHITETGLLTNNSVLEIGEYGLRVYVEDIFGNVQDWEVRIRVYPSTTTATTTSVITTSTTTNVITTSTTTTSTQPSTTTSTTTPPPDGDYTIIIIIIGVGGIVIIIIIVIISKKR